MPAVFFYISGHGFGHASRQIEIINAVGSLLPADVAVVIRTSAAPWLFQRTVRVPFTLQEAAVDTGVLQIDSLHLDDAGTIARAADFYSTLEDRAASEAAMLRRAGARLVVSDAPPLGCAAAHAAGIPSAVCSNFTWDWIYQAYDCSGAPGLIASIQDAYGHAAEGWRLPMHGGFETIAPIVDVPLVARHARHERDDVRRRLDLPSDVPLAMASFGGYGVHDFDPARLDCLNRVGVILTGREPWPGALPRGAFFVDERLVYERGLRYEDLVAAVDVVVTKPGYGIISECVANETAMLYTSRGRFVEYDVLVAEMPTYLRCEFIDHESLFAGRWAAALDRLLGSPPPPERVRTDGADVVAAMIVEMLNAERRTA